MASQDSDTYLLASAEDPRVDSPHACPAERSDAELLAAWQRGEAEALSALVVRHQTLVLAWCRRLAPSGTAEDAAQAVFLVLMRRPAAAARAPALAAWLLVVARHVCARAQRDRQTRQRAERSAGNAVRPATDAPGVLDPHIEESLDVCLRSLPVHQREAIVLHYLLGKEHADGAAVMGVSLNAFRLHLSRGLAGLRARLRLRGVAMPAASLHLSTALATTAMSPALTAWSLAHGTASTQATLWSQKVVSAMILKTLSLPVTAVAGLAIASSLTVYLAAVEPQVPEALRAMVQVEKYETGPRPEAKQWNSDPFLDWDGEETKFSNPTATALLGAKRQSQAAAPPLGAWRALEFAFTGGNSDKSVIFKQMSGGPLLPERPVLNLWLLNPGSLPLRVSLAVKTGGQWIFHESLPQTVAPDDKQIQKLSFDLGGATWKSAATQWAHTGSVAGLPTLREIQVAVYNGRHSGSLLIAGFSFSGK